MPEAVIVSAARSPIGRANKGSLKDLRPDDLAAPIVQAALDKVPALDPHTSTTSTSAAACPAASPASTWPGSSTSSTASTTCPARRSPATAPRRCRPRGWRSTRSRPARATSSSRPASRRCRASPRAPPTTWPDTQNPLFAEAAAADRRDRAGRRGTGTTRARTARVPDVYIAMGQTAENVARLRGLTRQELDEFGVRSQNLAEKAIANGFWATRDHPGDDSRRHGGRPPTTARAPASPIEAVSAAQAGLPPRRRRDRRQLLPAQRRRGGGRDHVRHQGRRAGPHPARPDRVHRRQRASPRRSWASARSRRPSGPSPTPA